MYHRALAVDPEERDSDELTGAYVWVVLFRLLPDVGTQAAAKVLD